MGFTLPSPDNPKEHARTLIAQKDAIEAQIQNHIAVLKANNCDMKTPLVDGEGFPRDDIDIYAVRGARVRIIELRNDLAAVMNAVGKALEGVYELKEAPSTSTSSTSSSEIRPSQPFAKVNGVAPGSPAAEAGLQREDLVVKFGTLTDQSFTAGSLQPIADHVAEHENRSIPIKVLRSNQSVFLSLTPRKDWGGRGLLGCHIVPYTPS